MKEDLDLFSINVANVIGNNVDPFIVKEIISISNNEKYIFHGIKNNKCFYRINIEGIKPLSPEGGKGSYWSSGKRLFGSETSVFSTYDTTFFHYAHTNESENKSLMSLAILKYENSELKLKDFFKIDKCMIIHQHIPRELIHLLRLEVEFDDQNLTSRVKGQIKEKILLCNLYNILKFNYKSGELTLIQERL